MTPYQCAIITSIYLTIICMAGSGVAVYKSHFVMREIVLTSQNKSRFEAYQLLVLAFVFAKLGSVGDQTWWGIAWRYRLTDTHIWEWWFDNGIYPNIVFRQLLQIFSNHCFIVALIRASDVWTGSVYRFTMGVAFIFATVITSMLVVEVLGG